MRLSLESRLEGEGGKREIRGMSGSLKHPHQKKVISPLFSSLALRLQCKHVYRELSETVN